MQLLSTDLEVPDSMPLQFQIYRSFVVFPSPVYNNGSIGLN